MQWTTTLTAATGITTLLTTLVGLQSTPARFWSWRAPGAGPAATAHRLLATAPMVTLGRWSYGIFIWHLAALTMVFPVIGEFSFRGHMPEVLALTLIFAIAIAAVSYALVESPCREALRRWESRRKRDSAEADAAAVRPPDSVISRPQEDAIAP